MRNRKTDRNHPRSTDNPWLVQTTIMAEKNGPKAASMKKGNSRSLSTDANAGIKTPQVIAKVKTKNITVIPGVNRICWDLVLGIFLLS
jgi:hypothetical protein